MSKGPQAETFVFLDLEATGLPSVDPKIAEISLFAVHRSSLENPKRDESDAPVLPQVPDELTLCMSPERPFTAKASEITGLSSEGLARCPKAGFDGAVVQTPQAFLSCQEGPLCLVAHNGFDYDFPLLCTELPGYAAGAAGPGPCPQPWHSGPGPQGLQPGQPLPRLRPGGAEGHVHTRLMVFLHRAAELLAWADEHALSWARVEPMYVPPDGPSLKA
ncbi:hypothetical protein EI555_010398 [Monodon monoceros]|uniref:exodeoxyribonuclease III n=1 Tax=Monodon monoceros TaxID=40151 RepID=A0A4U1EAZ1_MONMO|nr:hypothetical protein EI555_015154 [Monodon monoceros]TKC33319.1 hypothetical protein EI555_010398 [Monodon monoceros]